MGANSRIGMEPVRTKMRDVFRWRAAMGMERGTGGMGAGCADFIRDRFGYRRCRAFSSVVWVVALLCLGHPVQRVAAAEWSQFRGWNSSGVMETSSLPVRFGPHRNLVWRASTAPGRSSPILTREHIFLSAVEGEQLWVICLDRSSGDLQWRQKGSPAAPVRGDAPGQRPRLSHPGDRRQQRLRLLQRIRPDFVRPGRPGALAPAHGALQQPHGAGRLSHAAMSSNAPVAGIRSR